VGFLLQRVGAAAGGATPGEIFLDVQLESTYFLFQTVAENNLNFNLNGEMWDVNPLP
jgi:hypothetical protein